MKRKILVGLGGIFVAGVVGLLVVARVFYPTNIAETAADQADESLRTRHYRTDLKTFAAEAARIVPTISTYGRNWRLAGSDAAENEVVVRAEVPVVVFTDDLRITARREPAGDGVVVDVHSNSRVGKSDFGENRRHLRQLLDALDARFK
ncbi:MAG: DUF1499 domain-containing protein [Acidobacteria bacterium]|nr:DUF1499 domain-containing protein [Acidobacteriota bacterium]